MSTVIVRRPVNRLAKLIRTPGGPTVAQAIADVDERLGAIREPALAELLSLMAAVQALARVFGPAPADQEILAVYNLCNEMLAIAQVAGYPQLGQAALSLCELLDGSMTRKVWSPSAVRVHLDGLLLLADPAQDAEQSEAIVAGLRQVVQRTLR